MNSNHTVCQCLMKVCWKDLQIPENKIMSHEEIKVEIAK